MRLAAEPGLKGVISGQIRTQCLDRDHAVQPEITCAVDLGHAAAPDDPVEFIAVVEPPRLSRHVLHCPLPFISGANAP